MDLNNCERKIIRLPSLCTRKLRIKTINQTRPGSVQAAVKSLESWNCKLNSNH